MSLRQAISNRTPYVSFAIQTLTAFLFVHQQAALGETSANANHFALFALDTTRELYIRILLLASSKIRSKGRFSPPRLRGIELCHLLGINNNLHRMTHTGCRIANNRRSSPSILVFVQPPWLLFYLSRPLPLSIILASGARRARIRQTQLATHPRRTPSSCFSCSSSISKQLSGL